MWAADEMEPALRRGDRDGVGGGSRIVLIVGLCLHAQFMSASAAARMNEIELKLNDAGLGGTVWLLLL